MTENELIDFLEDEISGLKEQRDGVIGEIAAKVFLEINGKERISKLRAIIGLITEVKQYRKLGTVEELREASEKTKPKKIKYIHKEYKEHDWSRKEDGEINDMAFSVGFHNGPVCKRCGYSFCIICDQDGWNKEKCEEDYYKCPTCGADVYIKSLCCSKCGQRLEE